jgi:hypothetical protein
MSEPLFSADDLPLEAEKEIDRICDRFEAAWRAGSRPRVEEFWSLPDEPARTALLRELLRMEVEYRRRGGEIVSPEHYVARFPGREETIRAVMNLCRVSDTMRSPNLPGMIDRLPGPGGEATRVSTGLSESGGTLDGPVARLGPASGTTVVSGYEILEELGRGGMGVVYKARQTRLGRLVALKLLRGGGPWSPEAVRRFDAEARTVARFDHPNIVRVYDSGEHAGVPYLALEFMAGGSLAQRLRSGPWPARKAAKLVAQLAGAVEYAHRQKVIHRDLKPANVLLAEDGTPKVADFGLARLLDHDGGTVSGEPMGTPCYMSPEQAGGRPEAIGPATDIFGLGAILYELLTGRTPLQGGSVGEVLQEARHGRVSPPRVLRPRIPRALERICLRALSPDPAGRQGSAAELARELRWFLGRERRRLWVAGLVAVGLLVGLVGWLLGPGPPGKEKLSGELIVEVWTPPELGGRKQGIRVQDPGALPVRAGEEIHIRAELSEPAHAYLLLLNSQGEVVPLYPWNEQKIEQETLTPPPWRPAQQVVHSPTGENRRWPMDNVDGLETVLLLARRTPLPGSVDLVRLIGRPPTARLRDSREWAVRGGDEGQTVDFQDVGMERGIRSESVEVDEPLLQLLARLRPHFEVLRAVRFAHQGS